MQRPSEAEPAVGISVAEVVGYVGIAAGLYGTFPC
jgi:hypothetical protein